MSALTVTIGADLASPKRGLAVATEAVAVSARRMATISGKGLAGLGKGASAALGTGFSLAVPAIHAGIAGAVASGAAAMAAGVKSVTSAADFEQTSVAFKTRIGDAGKAQETLAKLRKFADATPIEFPEIADAGRKLIACGESADTVPDTLRRIHPIFPAFRSGHRLCQRLSSGKQFPSNRAIMGARVIRTTGIPRGSGYRWLR
ncbi:MAG: hypothetical protein NTW21_18090 [Verrucomicrobia bacterium]|nr:hypothetical protein [Verrucomicrobiota bacterium]